VAQVRLRQAVDEFSNASSSTVDVQWKPFQIDPNTAEQGEGFEAYNRRRWGSSGWTNHLRREGAKSGATFQDWKWWPNTLKAHQWIQYGIEKHNIDTDKANQILFQAIYEHGENISLTDTLVKLAKKEYPDWNLQELQAYLEHNQGAQTVRQEIDNGRRKYRISGVPFFVVGAEGSKKPPYGFSGAQAKDTFLEVFNEVAEQD